MADARRKRMRFFPEVSGAFERRLAVLRSPATATRGRGGGSGVVSTGGMPGTGGFPATGGVMGTGGLVATGGVMGSGGVGSGGIVGTGGIVGSGGISGCVCSNPNEVCDPNGQCVCSQTDADACSAAGVGCGKAQNICGQSVVCTCPPNSACDTSTGLCKLICIGGTGGIVAASPDIICPVNAAP